jgi:hypothetical protein
MGVPPSDPAVLVYFPQGASDTNWAHSIDDVGDVWRGFGDPVLEPHEATVIPMKRTAATQAGALSFFIAPTYAEVSRSVYRHKRFVRRRNRAKPMTVRSPFTNNPQIGPQHSTVSVQGSFTGRHSVR